MGRVILKHNDGRLESLKCKSLSRATEIAKKRPSVLSYNYYEDNTKVPDQREKKQPFFPSSFEELAQMDNNNLY